MKRMDMRQHFAFGTVCLMAGLWSGAGTVSAAGTVLHTAAVLDVDHAEYMQFNTSMLAEIDPAGNTADYKAIGVGDFPVNLSASPDDTYGAAGKAELSTGVLYNATITLFDFNVYTEENIILPDGTPDFSRIPLAVAYLYGNYTPVYEMQGVAGSRWPFLVTGEDSFRLACSQWKYVGEGIQFYEYDYNNLIYDIYMSAFIIPKQTGGAWIPIAETMVRARFSHLYQVEYDLNYPGGAAAGSTVQASFKDNLTYLALPVLTEPADAERYEQIGWEITGTDIIPYQTGSGLYDAGSIRVSGVPTEAVQ